MLLMHGVEHNQNLGELHPKALVACAPKLGGHGTRPHLIMGSSLRWMHEGLLTSILTRAPCQQTLYLSMHARKSHLEHG
jgi:hypothetical protein